MEQWLLLHVPTAVLGFVIVCLSASLSVIGLILVRRRMPFMVLEQNNEIAGFFMSIIGTAYAILMAFVIFSTWQKFTAADDAVTAEANSLGDLIRIAQQFPDPERHELFTRVRAYAVSVTEDEWKAMAHERASPQAFAALNSMWQAYAAIDPQTNRASALYGEVLRHLGDVSDHRRDRIRAAATTIPGTLWVVLLASGAATIGFTYCFAGRNLRTQAIMTAVLGGVIGLLLFVVLEFNLPFTGDISVPPTAFNQVFKLLDLVGSR